MTLGFVCSRSSLILSFKLHTVASNISLTNIHATHLRGGAFTISQCTRFSGAPRDGNCTNSRFQVRDISIDNLMGTSRSPVVTSLQCSAEAPCSDISIRNVDLTLLSNGGEASGKNASEYLCGNAVGLRGFNCTGTPCVGGSAIGECSSASGGPVRSPSSGHGGGGAQGSSGGLGRVAYSLASFGNIVALGVALWALY